MNEHMTVAELFYCLIQDIEDYTMRNEDEGLDYIVELLDDVKEHWDKKSFGRLELTKLVSVTDYLEARHFEQFYEDSKALLERVRNEIK